MNFLFRNRLYHLRSLWSKTNFHRFRSSSSFIGIGQEGKSNFGTFAHLRLNTHFTIMEFISFLLLKAQAPPCLVTESVTCKTVENIIYFVGRDTPRYRLPKYAHARLFYGRHLYTARVGIFNGATKLYNICCKRFHRPLPLANYRENRCKVSVICLKQWACIGKYDFHHLLYIVLSS